jgi:hypothetical protein
MSRSPFLISVLAVLGLFAETAIANAAVAYSVTVVDPGNAHSASYAAITVHIQAAGARWAGYLAGSGSPEV